MNSCAPSIPQCTLSESGRRNLALFSCKKAAIETFEIFEEVLERNQTA